MSEDGHGFIETSRLEGFSDGVFGVAMTLLGMDLKVPELNGSGHALGRSLLGLWPSYIALLVSFVTVLIMWMNHHAIFKYMRGANAAFAFVNGVLLLLVTIVPFSTALVAQYLTSPEGGLVCALYAGLFVLINVTYNLLWRLAAKNRKLLKDEVSASAVRSVGRKLGIGLPGYVAATVVALFSPLASLVLCCALWILWGRMAVEHFVPKQRVKLA